MHMCFPAGTAHQNINLYVGASVAFLKFELQHFNLNNLTTQSMPLLKITFKKSKKTKESLSTKTLLNQSLTMRGADFLIKAVNKVRKKKDASNLIQQEVTRKKKKAEEAAADSANK